MHRRSAAIALTMGLVVLAVPASATDVFSDVSNASPHHDAVRELADAGVTAGCSDDAYCPSDGVRRDQMASFMSRGSSRSTFSDNVAPLDDASEHTGMPASTTVQATGVEGGTGTVLLHGVVNVWADGAVEACPCEIEAYVFRDSDDATGPSSWSQLPGEAAGDRTSASLPVQWGVQIPSGTTETFHVAVFVDGAAGQELQAEASLTSLVAPMGEVPAG